MKSNVMLSIDSELLVEARGVGVAMSKVFTEALKKELGKLPSDSELEEKKYLELKKKAFQASNLYPTFFTLAVRKAKFLGLPSNSTKEKVDFWEKVINLIEELKESTPETPKEGI